MSLFATNQIQMNYRHLLRGARDNDIEKLAQYVNTVPDIDHLIDVHLQQRSTCLYHAVRSGAVEAATFLMEHGADPNIRETQHGWTPLIVCIRATKNLDFVRLLLRHGADPRMASFVGRNAWVYARQLRRSHLIFSRRCRQLLDDWKASVFLKRLKLNAKIKRRVRERNLLKHVMRKKNIPDDIDNFTKDYLNHKESKLHF